MKKNEIINKFLNVRFKKSDPALAEAISKHGSIVTYKKRDTLYMQGDVISDTYFLISGLIKLYRQNEEGKEVVYKYIFPGDAFAKGVLETTSLLSAEALEMCELLVLDKAIIKDAVFNDREMMEDLFRTCRREIEFYVSHIEGITLMDTTERLENFLVQNSQRRNSRHFRLPVARCELATLLGTTPENLSRIIKNMTAKGRIRINGRDVTLNF